jgi:hypothetical protein
MNTTSKFVVLSALAALMVAGTMAVALSDDANAQDIRNRNNRCGDNSQCGQQNSGETGNDVQNVEGDNNQQNFGDVFGGNNVGGDLDNSR